MASSKYSCQYPSPSYQTLQTFFDTQEDFPGPRCGHTFTAVAHRLILFGGSTAVQPDGSEISLEGVTNSVHCFNVFTRKWKRVYPDGHPPSPRAFHAADSTGNMVAIQGGIGPSGPCTGEVHILNMTDNKFKWQKVVVVEGEAPGPRYGHVMGLAERRLVIFGGTNGNEILDDTWALDTTQKPNVWQRLNPYGNLPSGRMYASASTREDYYFILCGGIDYFGVPLGDVYGLKMLENGCWMWTPVPGVAPSLRYQHTAVFVGSRLHVIGGALSRASLIDGEAAVAVLDTSTTGEWLDRNGPGTSNLGSNGQYLNQLMRRCGHAAASVGYRIYVYGGLREGVLLGDFLVSEDDISQPSSSEPANASFMRRSSSESSLDRLAEAHANLPTVEAAFHASVSEGYARLLQRTVAISNERVGNLGGLVRQPSLDRFQRRRTTDMRASYTPQFTTQKSTQDLVKKVISTLLRPQTWEPPASREFFLCSVEVEELCSAASQIIKQEPTLLQLSAPIKVFGDLHGQFGDMMRLFYEYGYPSRKGDISYIDYLFLGDYVDRGTHSLETIILLLALKIEYPENIHLIRGNHESFPINTIYGFKEECKERMGEPDGAAAWRRINDVFDHLPLAALIEDKILCMHGGIGSTVFSVEQIANIQRPVFPDSQDSSIVVKDLLWSDPTENDSVLGVGGNSRGDCVVTFGPDVVKAFCERNNLDMIIRGHECVLDGFERFAQGQLITVFSATNYCGIMKNAGAILVIGRDLVIVPKLIHPLPPPISPSEYSPEKAWMPLNSERPPTPVRGRPNPGFERGSTS